MNNFKSFRNLVINPEEQKILLSKIENSEQEQDMTLPANCNGFGRIRHFNKHVADDWISDPLPIEPALKYLSLDSADKLIAQVFQIAICNLKCWYCFVPEILRCANKATSKWFSADEMLDMYESEKLKAPMIDLSGGNPELAPEWIVYMMKAIRKKNLENVFLWSDNSLITDFFFSVLSKSDLNFIKEYKGYGQVGCFKGFDEESFSFNSGLPSEYFDFQFEHFKKFIDFGIDMYGYVTLTTPTLDKIDSKISNFMDRLQKIHPLIPLRFVPLKIFTFSPVVKRLDPIKSNALEYQQVAIKCWAEELSKRFTKSELSENIANVNIFNK